MRRLGVLQGMAPVLDVVRPRWGRTEESIGEDPYLVGMIGTAYVRGLSPAAATRDGRRFIGYSGSQSGLLAPVRKAARAGRRLPRPLRDGDHSTATSGR
ncbi:MAG: glycoside hydrolase family 3 N-terminal domain-containing protein [Nocardioidaceae bacterium]